MTNYTILFDCAIKKQRGLAGEDEVRDFGVEI